jgi:hypothetical protein
MSIGGIERAGAWEQMTCQITNPRRTKKTACRNAAGGVDFERALCQLF